MLNAHLRTMPPLSYYSCGRVLSQGAGQPHKPLETVSAGKPGPAKPKQIKELLVVMVRGLRRAMHPLTQRRKGTQPLSFGSEYDVEDRA